MNLMSGLHHKCEKNEHHIRCSGVPKYYSMKCVGYGFEHYSYKMNESKPNESNTMNL